MNLKHHRCLISTFLILATDLSAGTVSTEGTDIIIDTDSGFEVSTSDKKYSFQLGGKIQWDVTSFDGLQAASQNQSFENTFNTFLRRGELSFEGRANKHWEYGVRLAYDDGNGEDNSTEVERSYITYSGSDFAEITIGKYGVDYGLENTTSSSWITAIERPFMYDFLNGAEDSKFGIMLNHSGKNYGLMAQVGHYDMYNSSDNNETFGYTFRANWTPYLNGNDVVHFGANFHDSHPDDTRSRARTRLGIRSDHDDKLTFGNIDKASKDTEWVLESGAQFGGLRLQAEYFQRKLSGKDDSGLDAAVDLNGYYGQVSYLFKGARKYKAGSGKWRKPEESDAIEIFSRYESSAIDADENAIPDELNNTIDGIQAADYSNKFTVDALVLGVNYFPVSAIRMSLNYINYHIDNIDTTNSINGNSVEDKGKAIIGRLQYSF